MKYVIKALAWLNLLEHETNRLSVTNLFLYLATINFGIVFWTSPEPVMLALSAILELAALTAYAVKKSLIRRFLSEAKVISEEVEVRVLQETAAVTEYMENRIKALDELIDGKLEEAKKELSDAQEAKVAQQIGENLQDVYRQISEAKATSAQIAKMKSSRRNVL